MASSNYKIVVQGILDDTMIRKRIAELQAQINNGAVFGGKGGSVKKGPVGAIAKTGKQADAASKNINKMNRALTQTGKASGIAGMGMVGIGKKVVAFGAVTTAIQLATAGMTDMVQNVFELDKALTEFKKVSDATPKQLAEITDEAFKLGRTVAKTGTEMMDAATNFRKSGYSDKDALQLGKIASLYQNIADEEISTGDASNFIISQLKAFNMEANQSMHTIDAVNEVANNFAVSSADIATNLPKASAALANGNVTFEQSIGLMTAITEI